MKSFTVILLASFMVIGVVTSGHALDAKPYDMSYYPPRGVQADGPEIKQAEAEYAQKNKEDKAYRENSMRLLEMYRGAAEYGNSFAQYMMALSSHAGGMGLERDDKKAVDWLQKSADAGYPDAQYDLGVAHHGGFWGVKKDDAESIKWISKAAEQNLCVAQTAMGIAYYNGWGVKKDLNEAKNQWLKSAKLGNAEAMVYLEAHTGMKPDAQSEAWLKGTPQCLMEANSRDMALDMYLKSAVKGNAVAERDLGNAYYFGEGVNKDTKKAAKWWRKSAAQGDVEAQKMLEKFGK